jgi:hypothetical protein
MHRLSIDIASKYVPYVFQKFDKNGNGAFVVRRRRCDR